MWFWMYDVQVQGSEITILLTLHSRFSAFSSDSQELSVYGINEVWGFMGIS